MLASTFFLIVGLVAGGVVTAGGAAIFIPILTRESRDRKKLFKRYAPDKSTHALPKTIETELTGLRSDLEQLVKLGELPTAKSLSGVISLAQDLFAKLKSRGDAHQVDMAAVSYCDVLGKLNKALSNEYFFDMVANPEHWKHVEDRRATVREAVKAVNAELLESIRSLNSYTDMDYGVEIDSILRKSDVHNILKDLIPE